ncbi:disease resistance protein RPP13-like [Andrographis paniculata]|uniref:disease resistance protein RPP13-like n=1 Tax=Andrographis paniculata TaxID=175694 RepID=UPI0021E70BDA|nr:disease resistance protein RPP13-like [Andrographis paniculata]
MAVAYAAVLSLIHAVRRVQRHGLSYRQHVDQIGEMGCLLHDFLKLYSLEDIEEEEEEGTSNIERQIVVLAHEAEDAIEDYVIQKHVYGSRSVSSSHIQLLERVKQYLNSLLRKVMEIPELRNFEDQEMISWKRDLVGLETEQDHVLESLIQGDSSCLVIPITGVGGIGKTSLARSIYENNLVLHHFDVRIWITMFHECTVRDVLLQIPICKELQTKSEGLVSENELGELLQANLHGRRYLIILDGMTSLKIWDDISSFFPNDHIGSRILVTSRLSSVATYYGFLGLKMRFLDESTSWQLLCQTTFGRMNCPYEFEHIGKEITRKCKGFPS